MSCCFSEALFYAVNCLDALPAVIYRGKGGGEGDSLYIDPDDYDNVVVTKVTFPSLNLF